MTERLNWTESSHSVILLSELRVGWTQCLWIKLMTRFLSWEIVTWTLIARLSSRQYFSYHLQCRMSHLYISMMSTVRTNTHTHTHKTLWSSLESIQIHRLPYIETHPSLKYNFHKYFFLQKQLHLYVSFPFKLSYPFEHCIHLENCIHPKIKLTINLPFNPSPLIPKLISAFNLVSF